MTETIEDELLVYDERNQHGHALTREAHSVWKLCNGRRSSGLGAPAPCQTTVRSTSRPTGSHNQTSPYIAFANFVTNFAEGYVGAVGTSASYMLTDLTTTSDSTSGTLTAGNSIFLPVVAGDDITVEVSFA